MATVMVNGSVEAKRGVFKAFRDYLNVRFAGEKDRKRGENGRYHQDTREYGDYLYFQDRAMFDVELERAMRGDDFYKDFARSKWIATR